MTDSFHNIGDCNTGALNIGGSNSGDYNLGNANTGNRNQGDFNTGDFNSGNYNSGDWNYGSGCTGVFCTEEARISFFDKPSEMTLREWHASPACKILSRVRTSIWIPIKSMTLAEKLANPCCKENGGYLKTYNLHEAFGIMWSGLSSEERSIIQSIPNFDSSKFKKITNINI